MSKINIIKVCIAVVIIILILMLNPFAIVPAGNRGVLTTFGKPKEEIYSEGLHFRIPLVERMNLVNVSIQSSVSEGEAASKDLQIIHAKTLLNYHVEPAKVAYIYVELGNNPESRIISPSIQEAVKAVTARYTAEELISKRTEVREAIVGALHERLERHGLKIDEFSIINFNFSHSFNEAIEAKTTAEQLKLKAERDLQRIQVEAQQKIATAKAEAESLAAQRMQITPELIELRKVQNEASAIEKWNGALPMYSGGAMPFLNLTKIQQQ